MEKLIELLNEYNKIQNYAPIEYYDEGCDGFETNYQAFYKTTLIISKKFGFIKWLVDNDKIDFEKMEEQTKCKRIVGGEEFADFDIERDFTPYEEVLMWLAIQNEPIEFLISILK